MNNWSGSKSALLKLSLTKKREYYKCGDDFQTINDILDWGKYSTAAKAKLVPSEIGETPVEKDMETDIGKEEKAAGDGVPVTGNVSHGCEAKTNIDADEKMENDQNIRKNDESSEKARDETAQPVAVTHDDDNRSNADVPEGIDKDARKNDESSAGVPVETDKDARQNDESSEKADAGDETVPLVAEEIYAKNEILNGKISLFTGDITCLEIDAIVNAANDALICGGGVDNAIHCAAGRSMLGAECRSLNGCDTGDAKITGGYLLPAKYVIHAVGPKGEHPDLLVGCYKKAMDLMKEHKLETIAFPCISTGIYGYPNEKAANVALATIRKWLDEDEYSVNVKRVIFCLFLKRDIDIYHKLMPKYFPF